MKGAVYCLGWIGALVYYVQTAGTAGDVVLGFLKSIVWPAFVVHALMGSLGM